LSADRGLERIHRIGDLALACSAGGAGLGEIFYNLISGGKSVIPAAVGAVCGAAFGIRNGYKREFTHEAPGQQG
jgi:outer membrane lipoprotein SlyB